MITAALKTMARRLLADELRTKEQDTLEALGRLEESARNLAAAAEEAGRRLCAAERRVRTQAVLLTEVRDALDEAGAAPGEDLAQRVRALAAARGAA